MKAFSYIKAILSGLVWGSGQLLNRQYLKALFFFIIFVGFVGTELFTSNYFIETSPYDKLVGEDLGDDWYVNSFLPRYLDNVYRLKKLEPNQKLEDYLEPGTALEEYIASVGGYQNAELASVYPLLEEGIEAATEDEVLAIIADDLKDNNPITITELSDGEVTLLEDFDLTGATLISRKGVLYADEEGSFYVETTREFEDGNTQKEFVKTTLLTDERDYDTFLLSNEGLVKYEKTDNVYIIDDVLYIKVEVDGSIRYLDVLTETLYAGLEAVGNEIDIDGPLYLKDDKFYEYYEAGSLYLSRRLQFKGTDLTASFREALYNDYSAEYLSYTNADFNRLMLKIYFNVYPDIKETFETEYENFFYDRAGLFIRSYWSVATLGVANKVNYTNHMSLAEAVAGLDLTEDEYSLFSIPGFILSENIPLQGHVSTLILLEGLIGVILTFFFAIFMIWSISDAFKTSEKRRHQESILKDSEYFKDVYERSFEYIILSPAMFVLAFISIMPIAFGFLIAFTSISGNESMLNRFDWVGFSNFLAIFDFSSGLGASFGQAFWRVLGWTVVWAIFSTGTVFFGGFFQALILNSEKVVFRKFWRTLFILPWAIPALLSQMVFSVMFKELGFVNNFLQSVGVYDILYNWGMLGVEFTELSGIRTLLYLGYENIQWFTNPYNPTFVRTALIVINIWLGFPYFMALMTGVMTAIDKTLYEAADIDGANGWQKIRLITMPLVLYSTAPILIMTFSGNFNNFGIIYFVTGGGPNGGKPALGFAGDTDILISWMYKLTVDYSIYNMASVFSVLIFIFVGSVTAWNLSKTRAFQED